MDDDGALWFQIELETRQREESDWAQAMLAADPAYLEWLDLLDRQPTQELIP